MSTTRLNCKNKIPYWSTLCMTDIYLIMFISILFSKSYDREPINEDNVIYSRQVNVTDNYQNKVVLNLNFIAVHY